MIEVKSEYAKCVRNSENVAWRVDDVMPAGQRLDFSRPFLPESLARTEQIAFLSSAEQRTLNHITSNAYINLFAFAEEYVLSLIIDAAKDGDEDTAGSDTDRVRALMRFADEEAKHQQLFLRYCRAFARDFGSEARVLDSAVEVAKFILSKHQIAVLLLTLHIELTTQLHYTQSIRDNAEVDPLFASLLKHHWLEEAHHAAIDVLELKKQRARASKDEIATALDEYFELAGAFLGLLREQAQLDVDSLARATGRVFTDGERQALAEAQTTTYSQMFMSCGMLHKRFLNACNELSDSATARVYDWVSANCPEASHALLD